MAGGRPWRRALLATSAKSGGHERDGDGDQACAAAAPAVSNGYRTVTLKSDGRGHFQVEGGSTAGASISWSIPAPRSIALRESVARPSSASIRRPRDYTVKMQTANGVAGRAGAAQPVEVNGITVRDVRRW